MSICRRCARPEFRSSSDWISRGTQSTQRRSSAVGSALSASPREILCVRQILLRDFSAYKSALAEWTFTNADFKDAPVEDGDFVYADPPYDVEFTQYARGGFSWADQERTAIWLSRHPGPVVLVNQATGRIERLYRELGFRVGFLDAPRRIGCTGDRSPAREIIGTLNVVRMANSGQL